MQLSKINYSIMLIVMTLFTGALFLFTAVPGLANRTGADQVGEKTVDYKKEADDMYRHLEKTWLNYIHTFHLDQKFPQRLQALVKDKKYGEKLYQMGNYVTARLKYEKVLDGLGKLAQDAQAKKSNGNELKKTTGDASAGKPSGPGKKGEAKVKTSSPDPCIADSINFATAYRAEKNGNLSQAVKSYRQVVNSTCLPEADVKYAREFLEKMAHQPTSTVAVKEDRPQIEPVEVVEQTGQPGSTKPAENPTSTAGNPGGTETTNRPGEIVPNERILKIITGKTGSDENMKQSYFLAMDVWQSAWKADFSVKGLQPLVDYLARNKIRHINLNPGLPMGEKYDTESYQVLKPVVDSFYANGVQQINFLYAELNYPIEDYAKFLAKNPNLKIDTIVDDSELTDFYKDKFAENLQTVHRWGIKYSAFVTLELKGNSGVSDATRFWALENVDYPILMSYLSCTLEGQKQQLEKYLSYADALGKRGRVGVAILLGGKSVGREISCEKTLDETALRQFLVKLYNWANSTHPSFAGLVIETNRRLPQSDLFPQASASKAISNN